VKNPNLRPRDASRYISNAVPETRGPAVILFGLSGALAVAAMGTGCASAHDSSSLDDGIGTVTQDHSLADAAPTQPDTSCRVAAEGCPCTDEGDSVACPGATIRTGNYTSCSPGTRTCSDGAWGACVGKTAYKNADTLTEDYASPCAPANAVAWGAIDVQGYAPQGSTIEVLVQTAASQPALDTASMVRVSQLGGPTTSEWTSAEVDAALVASGVTPAAWLRITLSMQPAPDGASPMVVVWRQATTCR
jgi:hypothetical protein